MHGQPAPAPQPAPRRAALQNVGCKLNTYETEALKNGFHERGYEVVPFGACADVYVVNTCTVTGAGDADSRKAVRRARRANPEATVVATGCYAQRCPDELRKAGAQLVVGNGHKAHLVEHVEAHLAGRPVPAVEPGSRPRVTSFLQITGAVEQGRTRGTLQIQDGCDEHCTYCVIPQVRGPGVSRTPEAILEQARRMVQAGYRELALTGVHSGSYGCDAGRKDGLVRLLEGLEQVPGLARIRLNSIEPAFLSDALIRHAAASGKLCRHFHVPLQSGDDHILRRMGRGYTRARYAERMETIATLIPDCALGADLLVGFPGEEESHFQNTCDLIADLPLTYLHVFPFSQRADTPAARLDNHQTPQVKKVRARRLRQLGARKRLEFHRRFLGRTVEVLIEAPCQPGTDLAFGLTDNYIKAASPQPDARANQLVQVRVTEAREDLVFGEGATP